jgi:hypothetical protein
MIYDKRRQLGKSAYVPTEEVRSLVLDAMFKGWPISDVAKFVGCHPTTLGRIVSGRKTRMQNKIHSRIIPLLRMIVAMDPPSLGKITKGYVTGINAGRIRAVKRSLELT